MAATAALFFVSEAMCFVLLSRSLSLLLLLTSSFKQLSDRVLSAT